MRVPVAQCRPISMQHDLLSLLFLFRFHFSSRHEDLGFSSFIIYQAPP